MVHFSDSQTNILRNIYNEKIITSLQGSICPKYHPEPDEIFSESEK